MTTEKAENFNDSFNDEFCQHLEYHLSNAFANSDDNILNKFWCDGVSWAPYFAAKDNIEYLSYDNVKQRGFIKTTSWIGISGQDRYEMQIKFGEVSLERYKEGLSLIDCLPDSDTLNWINIDTTNRTIEIKLK